MQLKHLFAAGRLMEPVDVLRHDGAELSLPLQLGQAQVGAVRLDAVDHELFPMEAVILLRVPLEKAVAQDRLWRISPFLVIQAVDAAEIGDAALRADAGAAEENDIVALRDPVFQLKDLLVHDRVLLFTFFKYYTR